ncbi:MAG: hypothetical protein E7006_02905 [Alphaproteobacteria bacterium]|nr:hypothetical protein [Alphaproteobacteria bacterium]
MLRKCPYEQNLDCDGQERADEYYHQMMESMLSNKPAYFIINTTCPVDYMQCLKLRAYQEKMQNQK